jgi:hypothetical protein
MFTFFSVCYNKEKKNNKTVLDTLIGLMSLTVRVIVARLERGSKRSSTSKQCVAV